MPLLYLVIRPALSFLAQILEFSLVQQDDMEQIYWYSNRQRLSAALHATRQQIQTVSCTAQTVQSKF